MKKTLSLVAIAINLTLVMLLAGSFAVAFAEPEPKAGEEAEKGALKDQWMPLLKIGEYEKARKLCEGWLEMSELVPRVEAHKCLANVELGEAMRPGDPTGEKGAAVKPSFAPEKVDKALWHLNQAIELSPKELGIHQGRIALLKETGRLDSIKDYLRSSIKTYGEDDPEAVDTWLASLYSLFEEKEYEAALENFLILEEYYPDSHKVLANIGALHSIFNRDEEAEPYLKRAVELSPEDPINNWNLARIYELRGSYTLAEQYYLKALEFEPNSEKRMGLSCFVAKFYENRLGDVERGCMFRCSICPPEEPGICRELFDRHSPEHESIKRAE